MEIPSKDVAYDPEKDVILSRAARILYGNEVGLEKLRQLDWSLNLSIIHNTLNVIKLSEIIK